MTRLLGGFLLLLLASAVAFGMLRPVCVPFTPQAVRQLRPRFDDREDRDLLLLKIYQRRDGVPSECKTWITRQLLW
jgi:hypothetical protein